MNAAQSEDITSLSGDNVAICHIVNAIATKNYGLAGDIAAKYPYADIYGDRIQLYNLNRARVFSRDHTGDVKIFKEKGKPFVIALIAHYAPGEATDCDPAKPGFITTSTDRHYAAGLSNDTLGQRVNNLGLCINKLTTKIPQMPITHMYVPAGTGSSLKGDVWKNMYLPTFQKLEKSCSLNKIQCIIVEKKNRQQYQQQQELKKTREWQPLVEQREQPCEIICVEENGENWQIVNQHFYNQQQQTDYPSNSTTFPEVDSATLHELLTTLPARTNEDNTPHNPPKVKQRPRKEIKKRVREDEAANPITKKQCI